MSDSVLPGYRNPPVVEIVLAVQFRSMPQFGLTEAVAVARAMPEWRVVDVPPALSPIVEAEPGATVTHTILLPIGGGGPVRVMLASEDDRWLAQLQQDRIAVHERQQNERPSFANVAPKLLEVASAVEEVLGRNVLAEGSAELVETIYVNRIPFDENWTSFKEVGEVLRALDRVAEEPPYDEVEAVSWTSTRVLLDGDVFVGRLRAQADPEGGPDGIVGLHLQMISRRYALGRALGDVFEACHTDIVEGFTAITTENMHKTWGRI